jgi:hypothetical protein
VLQLAETTRASRPTAREVAAVKTTASPGMSEVFGGHPGADGFEQDRHRWSTQIPLLLHAQAVVIAAAAVSAARPDRFSLRIRGIADRTSSCDSCPQSAVIRPSFYTRAAVMRRNG